MANKNKRPHCCQHCVSVVRQCKCFKDLIFKHRIYAVLPTNECTGCSWSFWALQTALCQELLQTQSPPDSQSGTENKFSHCMHGHSTLEQFSPSFLPSIDIHQEIIKFQTWWVSTESIQYLTPPFFFSFYLSCIKVIVNQWLWGKPTV